MVDAVLREPYNDPIVGNLNALDAATVEGPGGWASVGKDFSDIRGVGGARRPLGRWDRHHFYGKYR